MIRVLSLGAGVQSTTLLYMAINGDIPPIDHAIFSDTGWEPAAVYHHLEHLETLMAAARIPFHRVSAGNIRRDALDPDHRFASMPLYVTNNDGTGGMVRRQCTAEYKLKPLLAKQRELAGLKPRQRSKTLLMQTLIGISWDETQRMRDPAFPWLENEYPLVDRRMTRQGCLDYCNAHGYELPPRSACIGCPFKTDHEWRLLRNTDHEAWADAVDFDRSIRRSRSRLAGELYLHRSRVPLDEVDLSTEEDRGQLNLFEQECIGMCGL